MKIVSKIHFILILMAGLAFLSLTCCERNQRPDMFWRVFSYSQDNVKPSFDAARHPQIEIFANAEGGVCKLSSSNFKNISFREGNIKGNVHKNYDCKFHAEITETDVITITFDKMSHDDQETSGYFIIDGNNDKELSSTVVKVTRIPLPKMTPVFFNQLADVSLRNILPMED